MLLNGTGNNKEDEIELSKVRMKYDRWVSRFVLIVLLFCAFLILWAVSAHAYTDQQLATAIGRAENSKSHPYGIMVKYAHTSPRQACLNTIHHKMKDYAKLPYKTRQKTGFLEYLASKYAPIGAENDPKGLNKNWLKNVEYYLAKEIK